MSWQKVKLKEVLIQIKDSVLIDNSKEYKLVTVSNKGVIKLREIVKGVEISANKAFVAKKGQFIYSRLSIHNGAFGLIPETLEGALVTSEMPLFEFKENIIYDFFIYSLQLKSFKFQLEQLTKGVGRTRVKENSFLDLVIDLPSIEIQNLIVSKIKLLEKDGANISNELNHQLDFIKQLRQAFLREAMQGKLVKSTNTKETGQQLLEKIKAEKAQLIAEKKLKKENEILLINDDEIPYNIPKNWVWCKFGEVVKMSRGKFSIRPRNDPSYFGGEYPFIQIGSLDESGSIIYDAPQSLNEKGLKVSKQFPKNTIVIAIVGGTIANLGILGREMCFTDSIVGIYPISWYNQEFVLNFLRYKQPEIKQASYQMAGQPNIKIPTLENLIFPLPPLHEQEQIVAKLEELMAFCDGLEGSIKESQGCNEMLLQQVLREALDPR
jgi:type I restriction enzyme S subunit